MQVRGTDQQAPDLAFSPAPGGSYGSCPSEQRTETVLLSVLSEAGSKWVNIYNLR